MLRNPVALLTLVILSISIPAQAETKTEPDPARVKQIAAMLPAQPRAVGPAIGDRAAWEAVAKHPKFNKVIREAEKALKETPPELTDDLFLDYSRTGNRTRCQDVMSRRHGRLPLFVLAECMENRGRFLPAIEKEIRELCGEKTWVMPAHDRGQQNFKGTLVDIDLQVAAVSWNLSTAAAWLGDRLGADVQQLVDKELERRTFAPFTTCVKTGKPPMWWVTGTNNWNAVCLAGVTGAAMAHIESAERRAWFAAAAEKNIRHFLDGITPDGYCSEGIGYWNYGYGHFVMLGETLRQSTGGKLDLMELAKARPLALFGLRMEIVPGVYPAFADCSPRARPDSRIIAFISRRYSLGLTEVEQQNLLLAAGPSHSLFDLGVYGFENSASRTPASDKAPNRALRNWFSDAGILICRPAHEAKVAFGAALKGGHNAENHNHNDVGSYVVALGNSTPLLDPGAEVYTARTFSSRRYESNVLNSFGHAVPRVAGALQRPGRHAEAQILKTDFTDDADTLEMDIRSAYAVKELTRLVRTFVFSRKAAGSLHVTDTVEFAASKDFGTALVTFGPWKQIAPDHLLVGAGAEAVDVKIDTGGVPFRLEPTEIHEHLHDKQVPIRLGIELTQPVRSAKVTVTIAPKGRE